MKRFISLALVIVMILVCGIVIAADDVETQAMCQHVGAEGYRHTSHEVEVQSTKSHDECHYFIYNDTEYVCLMCNTVWCDKPLYLIDEVFRHVWQYSEIYQELRCIYCWGAMPNP